MPLMTRFASFEEALAAIEALDVSVMKLGIERMQQVMATLGNPQDQIPTIHIVGTNGKGSTCALLESIYRTAGHKTGMFTSPHLIDVRERIQLDGNLIEANKFVDAANAVFEAMETAFIDSTNYLTYFECLNAMAFWCFAQERIDIALIEAGLGGRLDSTNVMQKPMAVAVTPISFDHMDRLGHTLEAIAGEKAGVFKKETPVFTSAQQAPEVLMVLEDQAKIVETNLIKIDTNTLVPGRIGFDGRRTFRLIADEARQTQYFCGLTGHYQAQNVALALGIVEYLQNKLSVTPEAIWQGIEQATWPGRFERFNDWDLVVDGSHNAAGFASLLETLSLDFADTPILWGITLLNNRNIELLRPLLNYTNTIGVHFLSPPDVIRFHSPELGMMISNAYSEVKFILKTSITDFIKLEVPHGVLKVLTGSLYTAGEALKYLHNQHK